MIGWGITVVFWLALYGWWLRTEEKHLAFRAFLLGQKPAPYRWTLFDKWFPQNPVRSWGLIITGFVLPWAVGGWLWWAYGAKIYLVLGGVVSLGAPVLLDRLFRWWWKRRCFLQWKEALRGISTVLRTGRPWVEAVYRVAEETPEPLRKLLFQMEGEIRLGSSEGAALRRLTKRTEIDALLALTTLIEMVTEKGGEMADALDDLASQWEEEEELLADLRAETGMYRLSAYLLPLLMLGLIIWFWPTISPLMAEGWFFSLFVGASLAALIGLGISIHMVSKMDV